MHGRKIEEGEFRMLRRLGFFYGAAFITGGVLGFMPGVTVDDMFLGIFMVNPLHSAMHVASGATFVVASTLSAGAARLWFQVFGSLYAALAAMGFWVGNGMILNCITNNQNDSWGHAGLALSMLIIGFATTRPALARVAHGSGAQSGAP
jgi:hypothetical protein